MNLRSNLVILLAIGLSATVGSVGAQTPAATPAATPAKEEKPLAVLTGKESKPATAEQVAETVIAIYGFPAGRATLNQIRKTTVERGRSTVANPEGKLDQVNYQRWIVRAGSLDKEKIRVDQEVTGARYSLVFDDQKIYGIFDNSVFSPREDASKSFENQIVRGIEALLRYKENGSTIALAGKEKLMGVDLYQVDVTDTLGRKTRFYISSKSFRVMMLEYEDTGVKYRRKFYDYRYAQGTLVPYKSMLWANDKLVEETEISTITFGQKVDDALFRVG